MFNFETLFEECLFKTWRLSKKQKKKRKNNKKEAAEIEEEAEESGNDSITEPPVVEAEIKTEDLTEPSSSITTDKELEVATKSEIEINNDDSSKKTEVESAKKTVETAPKPSICSVCKQEFVSRTKLFEHISKEGHAATKVVVPDSSQPLSHNAIKKNKRLAKSKK